MDSEQAILDAAIAWRIRLQHNTANAQDWQAFETWKQAAPMHAVVWERLQALGSHLQRPAASLPPLAATHVLRQAEAAQRRTARRKALMSLGILTTGGLLAWRLHGTSAVQHVLADTSTRRGERHRIALPDGGILLLNTDTAVNIAFTPQFRRIELLSGEIYLTSGHDPQGRPLFVQTRDGRAQALGTRYRVRLLDTHSEVAVDEGAVSLWPHDSPGDTALATLHAGDAALMTPAQVMPLPDDARMDAAAWTEGELSVREMALARFLDELSRHHGTITCDPAVAQWPVSGVFQLSDTRKVLALLSQNLPIEIQITRRWWGGTQTHVRARG
ncbi:FecR domain-containing protein [Corticimicrobacter populi]|uniref:Histidine kinase n=1 Tax=Corticimicrobacter populi TaxID=2175229 RepID=A0A2V1K4W9_9BURK|nr:FecR domain-containing protein [Corticimicrobacter populi]PWF24689.1 histidine kinase [Corticimicrobacter populi]